MTFELSEMVYDVYKFPTNSDPWLRTDCAWFTIRGFYEHHILKKVFSSPLAFEINFLIYIDNVNNLTMLGLFILFSHSFTHGVAYFEKKKRKKKQRQLWLTGSNTLAY